jgi:hypothetical protein
MGAYDEGKWEVKVIDLAPNVGVLKRGSVICTGSGGKRSIAVPGTEANI